jgi:hypothetical protein
MHVYSIWTYLKLREPFFEQMEEAELVEPLRIRICQVPEDWITSTMGAHIHIYIH